MTTESHSNQDAKDTHVQMWRHYDDLRQKKNTTFLTANTILIAIVNFSLKDAPQLVIPISALGTIIQIAWFLLLTRNGAYVRLHRELVGVKWEPASWTPRSGVLDRTLPVAFSAFWVFLLAQQIWWPPAPPNPSVKGTSCAYAQGAPYVER